MATGTSRKVSFPDVKRFDELFTLVTKDAKGDTWRAQECAVVQVWELCDACKGHGKTPIPRRIYAYRECKACKGRGQWEFGFPEHVG